MKPVPVKKQYSSKNNHPVQTSTLDSYIPPNKSSCCSSSVSCSSSIAYVCGYRASSINTPSTLL